jgi:hypothetical protein
MKNQIKPNILLMYICNIINSFTTKRLKEKVRRNLDRFPADFMLELKKEEWKQLVANCDKLPATVKHNL